MVKVSFVSLSFCPEIFSRLIPEGLFISDAEVYTTFNSAVVKVSEEIFSDAVFQFFFK